ncbi:helix-turn-helix domain-containing protein, partial [Luteibacter sp.]|uniref:helix-turn-helix domain-containing protein n=1 Tax=Luteibacter sp. TaxID=1886636 RepID=UPI002807A4F8
IVRAVWMGEEPESDSLRSHIYQIRRAIDSESDRPLLHTMLSAGYKIADLGPAASNEMGVSCDELAVQGLAV